jgi:hypothetical protein
MIITTSKVFGILIMATPLKQGFLKLISLKFLE